MKHTGPISSIACKDQLIATGGYDNRIILWDAGTHTALAQGMHDHLVNHCAFNATGTLLVSASSDYSARVWQVPSMRLQAVLAGHGDDVDMAEFSADGRWIATCALDRAIRLFDLGGQCLRTFLGHTGNIISLLWSGDGQRLVSSSVDGTLRQWDIASGREVACHDLSVRTDTIATDKHDRILAGDDRGRIAIIDQGRLHFHDAHRAGIKKVVYCPQRQVLITLSYDRTLAAWKIESPDHIVELRRTVFPAEIWPRAAAMFDADTLALGTFGSSYATYDWLSDSWDLDAVQATGGINAIAVQEGKHLTVGDAGQVLCQQAPLSQLGSLCNFLLPTPGQLFAGGQLGQLFDARSGRLLYQHHSPLNCGVYLQRPGGPHIAVGSYTGDVLVLALQPDGRLRLVQELKVYENAVKGLAVNQGLLFSVCACTDIAWHRCSDLRLVKQVSQAHDKIANACCALGEGGFATVSRDRTLRLWTDVLGEPEIYPSPHQHSIKSLCASTDGLTLMTGSYGGTLAAFDLPGRRWRPVQRPTMAGISSIAHDAQRACFLAASYDGNVYRAS